MAPPARARKTTTKSKSTDSAKPAPGSQPSLIPSGDSYLQRILNARVYEVARETSLTRPETWPSAWATRSC